MKRSANASNSTDVTASKPLKLLSLILVFAGWLFVRLVSELHYAGWEKVFFDMVLISSAVPATVALIAVLSATTKSSQENALFCTLIYAPIPTYFTIAIGLLSNNIPELGKLEPGGFWMTVVLIILNIFSTLLALYQLYKKETQST